jgi:hypothetical protein
MSCDAYRDLWTPFFTLFWRYWPDCPFPVYLGTNSAYFDDPRVRNLRAGNHEWSQRLKAHLQQIEAEYVLLLLEDYFFTASISTEAINESLHWLHRLNGIVLRLFPCPGPDEPLEHNRAIGRIYPYAWYRVSTQAAIWKKPQLLELLLDHESIWDFELKGSQRTQLQPQGFYSTYKAVIRYQQVVERGEWFWYAARRFGKQRIGCDFAARPVMSPERALKKALQSSMKRLRYGPNMMAEIVPTPATAVPSDAVHARRRSARVAFLTNFVAPYWKPVLHSLSASYPGMRVLVSTTMEPDRSWNVEWEGLDVVRQRAITFETRVKNRLGFRELVYVHLPIDTVGQLRRFRADVTISAQLGFRTLMSVFYRWLRPRSRLIVYADLSQHTEKARGWFRGLLRKFISKNADSFVVLGESGARYIRELGVSNDRIFKVPYATDVARFSIGAARRSSESARRLLYVGQLIERKGLPQFIDALSRWLIANPTQGAELVLAGDGALRRQLEELALPATLRLTLLGKCDYRDMPDVYSQSGIFVFPTLADTWGLVVNEAMAAGLPVLGSLYSQAVEELVEDGWNGWTFRTDYPEEMCGAIHRMMTVPMDVLDEMRERARSAVLRLTPQEMARRIEAAVDAMITLPGKI